MIREVKNKMAWVVTAKIGGRRVTSQRYSDKSQAVGYATATKRDRPGSNPRIKKVK